MLPRATWLSLIPVLGLLGGCRTPREKEPFPTVQPPSAVAPPVSRGPRIARVLPDGRLVFEGERPGLGLPLARFGAALVAARASIDGAAAEHAAFAALAEAIEASLARERPARLELSRTLAALEAELAVTEERLGPVPPPLTTRLATLRRQLEQELERPPSRARAMPGPAPRDLAPPLAPAVVTSFFGPRRDPFDGRERYHLGVDLEAAEGQPVRAAAPGVVVSAGWAGGHGLRVELAHDDGHVTGYSHLSEVHVTPGRRLLRGEVLGLAGATGRATGPHLHFELWRDGEPEDPLERLADVVPIEIRATPPLD